ncbi:MAG: hypothetical protein ACYTGP_05155 [Planctomycetota bacterium]|jgi:hypothetical protein
MRRINRSFIVAIVALLGAVASVSAQHAGDIAVGQEGGQIRTGIWSAGAFTGPFRVHAGLFGDSGFAGFTSDPGFDAPSGTFTPGSRIGFNVLDQLLTWNGAGFEPTAGETLTISFFSLSVETGAGPVNGFDIAVAGDGAWHKHLGYTLEPFGGAADGIYLLRLELYSDEPGLASSAPFWKVFRNDEVPGDDAGTEAAHLAAIAWVENNLACRADLDGSGEVGFGDILALIGQWGQACPAPCPLDLDGSGTIGFGDVLDVIAAWGACP